MGYDRLRKLYRNFLEGKKPAVSPDGLDKAVQLGWITKEEKERILAENLDE